MHIKIREKDNHLKILLALNNLKKFGKNKSFQNLQ